MAAIVPLAGEVLDRAALVAGFIAAAIGFVAFITRSLAILARFDESEVKRATAAGGLLAFVLSLVIICVDALTG